MRVKEPPECSFTKKEEYLHRYFLKFWPLMQNKYFAEHLSMAAYDNKVEEKRILHVLFLKIASLWHNIYVNQYTSL